MMEFQTLWQVDEDTSEDARVALTFFRSARPVSVQVILTPPVTIC